MDAEKKLARDLAAVNKHAKKAPRKKPVSTAKTAKTAALIVPIRQKLSPPPRPGAWGAKCKVLVVPKKEH